MTDPRVVAIVATMDTKAAEARFLADWFRARGYEPRFVDVGVPRDRWARRRDEPLATAAREGGVILRGWHLNGVLAGAIGMGGNQGTAACAIALRDLPLGLPKVLVSTVASGNLRPYLGTSDIAVVPAVADLLGGPNTLTRGVLERAAAMLWGAMQVQQETEIPVPGVPAGAGGTREAVGLTTLGNTQRAALRILERLRPQFEVIPFHASGTGGSVMEAMIEERTLAGVVDLTPHELLGEVLGDDIYAPVRPGRLTIAGRMAVPQVVAPGGLDYLVFGPPESVPLRYRARRAHHHNPYNTNVRATVEELKRLGEAVADRLNAARGPAAFLYPMKGWSEIGGEAGALADPEANEAFRLVVRERLRTDRVRYLEVDADINDPRFADEVAHVFLELMAARRVQAQA